MYFIKLYIASFDYFKGTCEHSQLRSPLVTASRVQSLNKLVQCWKCAGNSLKQNPPPSVATSSGCVCKRPNLIYFQLLNNRKIIKKKQIHSNVVNVEESISIKITLKGTSAMNVSMVKRQSVRLNIVRTKEKVLGTY